MAVGLLAGWCITWDRDGYPHEGATKCIAGRRLAVSVDHRRSFRNRKDTTQKSALSFRPPS